MLNITLGPTPKNILISSSKFIYLRYSISHKDKQINTLQNEIDNCKKYLEIEKIRFGKKLDTQFICNDSCLTRMVPSMILQPLYENAIKHGVYESTELIVIRTKVDCNPKYTEVFISNNIDPEAIPKKGEGFGLKSIRDRLFILYNDRDLLQVKKVENRFEVKLILPPIKEKDD